MVGPSGRRVLTRRDCGLQGGSLHSARTRSLRTEAVGPHTNSVRDSKSEILIPFLGTPTPHKHNTPTFRFYGPRQARLETMVCRTILLLWSCGPLVSGDPQRYLCIPLSASTYAYVHTHVRTHTHITSWRPSFAALLGLVEVLQEGHVLAAQVVSPPRSFQGRPESQEHAYMYIHKYIHIYTHIHTHTMCRYMFLHTYSTYICLFVHSHI